MAGSSSGGEEDGMVSGINVTPLVDICLVLLIIMMVTARIIANLSVPLDLPKAAKGVDQSVFFAIDLTKDGKVFVDNEPLDSAADVFPRALVAHEDNPEVRATIRADSSVSHGQVMEVIDYLKQAGITKVAFGVSKKSPERGVEVEK